MYVKIVVVNLVVRRGFSNSCSAVYEGGFLRGLKDLGALRTIFGISQPCCLAGNSFLGTSHSTSYRLRTAFRPI